MKSTASLVVLIALLVGVAALAEGASRPDELKSEASTVLVTGANRGLGLEFARQYRAAGWNVIGTARRPEAADELRTTGATVMALDVADAESVARLAKKLEGRPIDLVINNAGIGSRVGALAEVDFATVERVFAVNTLGPMRVTQALLPNLRAGQRKLVVHVTSGLGSIENNRAGGFYGYRESKAALNMFNRSLAAELKPDGFTCIVMSPGWVRTDMGGKDAPLAPSESIGGMKKVIDGLSSDDTGAYFGHDGARLPW